MDDWCKALFEQWRSHDAFEEALSAIKRREKCDITGLEEGAKRYFAAALASALGKSVLIVVESDVRAVALAEEMSRFLSGAMHLPARENQLHIIAAESPERRAQRIAALEALRGDTPCFVAVSAEALAQRLCPPEVFALGGVTLSTGQHISPGLALSRLAGAGYEHQARAEGPGQCALRGGILDVAPLIGDEGVRIEFFADDIDSIRGFDMQTQRSTRQMQRAAIPPASEMPVSIEAALRGKEALERAARGASGHFAEQLLRAADFAGRMTPFAGMENLLPLFYPQAACVLDYCRDAVVLLDEPQWLNERVKELQSRFCAMLSMRLESGDALSEQAEMMLPPEAVWKKLDVLHAASLQALPRQVEIFRASRRLSILSKPAAMCNGNMDLLTKECLAAKKLGYACVLLAGARASQLMPELAERGVEAALAQTLARRVTPGEVLLLPHAWPSGFTLPEMRLAVMSEVEIFGQQKRKSKPKTRPRGMELFADLKIGDYVVHEAHGIGKFMGMEKLTVEDRSRDYLRLEYLGGDKLFVPTDQLDRVQKYIGAGADSAPRLSRMGGAEWKKAVSRVRESVKALAVDLAKLYARRRTFKGIAFSEDTVWQRQLEERFPYEETPDQLQCIEEVKRNMESAHPMDRLLCGDVGYGKTEVAVRAVFKAVMDGWQAAFLVPTTILAEQHYQTLKERFEGFPVKVALLSRFCTQAQQRETLKALREGGVDVVVGTHMLLGKDVRFNKLGLLIVDEEQRFGVGHKEQIKALKENVDVLTLSATPIPRTLQLSLVGLRDMSVIETPPEDRFPVDTYVMEYSDELAREAIERELQRGGQVFFVYNQVQRMERFTAEVRRLAPGARVAMAHGQMPERQLEKTMLDFLAGEFDVLVCSTIIESGLDIANVNTIIVYDADRLGLSQLYQLRGRVGRSNRQGYAYLTFRRDKVLSEVAQKRLMAIREFTEFGAGFKIAMRDLEIRGAGNLLGPEQHGHLSDVGYDMYCKLVEAAVRGIKGEAEVEKVDTLVEIPLDAHIPHGYIPDETQRLEIYKRIAAISSKEERADVLDELIDRFGDVPEPVVNVCDIALYKAYASRACVTSLKAQAGEARMTLHTDVSVDTATLFELLTEYQGRVSLSATTPAVLVLKQKGADLPTVLALYDTFVHKLFDCVSLENAV